MITDEQIIKDLQEKEQYFLRQLSKIRAALAIYLEDDFSPTSEENVLKEESKEPFDQFLSYDQRVIFALRIIKSGYIDHMVDALMGAGDETEREKLYSGLTGAASRLYRKGLLRADTRGKKYKYSLNDNPEAEKERADILPFD
jgi:hypothetical protein